MLNTELLVKHTIKEIKIDTNDSIHCIRLQRKKYHHKSSFLTEYIILRLKFSLSFINYDSVFRSYNRVFHDRIVLFMQ